jgi:hypothetical protein
MIYNLIGYEEIDYRGMNEWIILQIGSHDTEELGDALDVEVDCDLGDTRVLLRKKGFSMLDEQGRDPVGKIRGIGNGGRRKNSQKS